MFAPPLCLLIITLNSDKATLVLAESSLNIMLLKTPALYGYKVFGPISLLLRAYGKIMT